jgi:hypothetical protein
MVEGTLVREIKATFEKLPEDHRGAFYPWFLKNQYLVDHTLPNPFGDDLTLVTMIRAWRFIGLPALSSSQQIMATRSTWPKHKQQCFAFYCTTLSGWFLSVDMDIWVTMGFCTCTERLEGKIRAAYHELMENCTFDGFCHAYNTSSLVALFDSKGLKTRRLQFPYLEELLRESPRDIKSVWYLKQFVSGDLAARVIERSMAVDYGFINCETAQERLALKEVYKRALGVFPQGFP